MLLPQPPGDGHRCTVPALYLGARHKAGPRVFGSDDMPIVFQALDWTETDEVCDDDDDDDGESRLCVKVFGRTVDGEAVSATLHGFEPSLLLAMTKRRAAQCLDIANMRNVALGTARLRDMAGYHPEPRGFTVLRFGTAQAFCAARRKLKDQGLSLYNCRLQPFMQLIHRSGVSPSGWVSVPGDVCDWKQLRPAEAPAPMAPFVVTSYDIECYSASGDFPAANKGYNKLARELVRFVDGLRSDGSAVDDHSERIEDAVVASLTGQPGALTPCELLDGQRAPVRDSVRQDLLMDLFDMMRAKTWARKAATERIASVAAKMNSMTTRGHREAMQAVAESVGSETARAFVAGIQRGGSDVALDEACLADARAAGKAASPWASPLSVDRICRSALKSARAALTASYDASDLVEQIRTRAERGAVAEAAGCEPPWRRPPLPTLKGDPIVQVGFTTRVGRSDELRRKILVLGTCDDVPGAELETFETEAALVRAFAAEIRAIDPDFVTGYNIMGFDFRYIRDRADELGVPEADMEMGRDPDVLRSARNPMYVEKRLVSAAYGDNTLRYYDMPGRVVFDLMKVVQREHKLSSYKLDAVAQHFTGDRKDDLSPADIFRLHAESAAGRALVAKYCVQDCALCSDLVTRLNTLPNAMGMADVCLVPTSWIFLRGQGCKVLSLVGKRCRLDGFALPELRAAEAPAYDGAHVLTPRIGMYLDTPVAVLDFSSLYPSSMIATNLSHDTMLGLEDPEPEGVAIEAVTFMLRERGVERQVTRRFVQAGADGAREGVLPRTLKTLLGSRAAVRKTMKTEPDAFARSVLDGLQQAYKVTANSLYGQLGSATSDIFCVDIAAATTAVGRSMLLKLRDFIEMQRGGDVVYGDSVAGYTPVFVRSQGGVILDTVEGVAMQLGGGVWTRCADAGREGKECIEFEGLEVWSDAGWTRVHRLIRHALAPTKRMLRVTTHTGIVDVTDDHSLLRPDGSVVKPGELAIGERLMHADLPSDFSCAEPASSHSQLSAARAFARAPPSSGDDADVVRTITELHGFDGDFVYDFTTDNEKFSAGVGRIVVHNTDSCFMTFPRAVRGLHGKEAVRATIAAAQEASAEFRKHIPPPQNAEYEKTFWPFILISKKRYVGNLYEEDADAKPKQKSMGLVLKRRDNAQIVKRVYGGVIDRLLDGADVEGAVSFVKSTMDDLVEGRVPVEELVVSKNLGGEYADPDRIAHAVLARRMAERDPGSAPAVGDRVPYVYVLAPEGYAKGALQGEKIEHPDHLKGQKLDYAHYITNQVMKPVAQLFALTLHSIPGCRLSEREVERATVVHLNECGNDEERARKRTDQLKQNEVVRIIFSDCLARCERDRLGVKDVGSYF